MSNLFVKTAGVSTYKILFPGATRLYKCKSAKTAPDDDII
jgi:hypothetical protein